jgi:hypothetical protein
VCAPLPARMQTAPALRHFGNQHFAFARLFVLAVAKRCGQVLVAPRLVENHQKPLSQQPEPQHPAVQFAPDERYLEALAGQPRLRMGS